MGKVPEALNDQLGIAIAKRTYKAYRELLGSPRWQRVYNAGARPQRLLWASTGTKDPKASDVLYIKALAAPFTVNTMPEGTLKAFADTAKSARACLQTAATARTCWQSSPRPASIWMPWPTRLQDEGAKSFVKSWNELMVVIASKSAALENQEGNERNTSMTAGLQSIARARPGRHSKPTIRRSGNCISGSCSPMIPSAASG